MNLLVEGIKYQLQAKKRHGIHSPFVFDLSTALETIKMDVPSKQALHQLAKEQKNNHAYFDIEDHGAGSKKREVKRSVSSLYSNSATKGKYGLLLYQLINHWQPFSILELGTSLGVGTLHMHFGNPRAHITTIEGSKKIASIAEQTLSRFAHEPHRIQVIQSTFKDYFKTDIETSFDFIYIDGHHDGAALLEYVECLKPYMHEKTIVLIDDIRWRQSMLTAWKTLCMQPYFKVSIDFFRMGCLCIRKHQEKEHFTLKF